ncbi:MAG TPA: putative metal-dependent hydrolase [Thermoanaerobaculia bacterium]|nr:putative metal-dependent hydrolase [Thermoanaerobaculia bacterium]
MSKDPRYPVGPFQPKASTTLAERKALIRQIADAPAALQKAIDGLNVAQLDTPYRDGGWTIRQVVHHVPDSHMGGFMRLKWAMTEDAPTIKAYDQDAWSKLPDVSATPVAVSVALLDNLHRRWMTILTSLDDAAFARALVHPDHGRVTVDWLVQMYAWHGRHHVAHITSLRERMRW